jgi:hypothetical protein
MTRTLAAPEDVTTLADLVARVPNNAVHPDADLLHKRYIGALVDAGGVELAESTYGLERMDTRAIDLRVNAVVACVVVRNEADRIPGLLAHHRRLGVERFFFVDNGSTDDTSRLLLDEADVHVWASAMPFQAANFGAAWFEVILRAHATDHWVVTVDADELLWYPDWETRALPELCAELDGHGHRALGAAFLDMYADGPVADTRVPRGGSPLDVCRYFDRRWFHTTVKNAGAFQNQVGLAGGVRRRVFGGRHWDYCLNKVPLLRYHLDAVLVGGQHATNLALAPTRGAVLHFKFDERLAQYARCELERGQRAAHAGEYHAYVEALGLQPRLTVYDPSESIELVSSAQLVDLGVMGPVPNIEGLETRAEALLRLAERKRLAGDRVRALGYLWRAADLISTSVTPLLRIAQLSSELGDWTEAARALDEAAARDPGNLSLLEVCERSALPGPLSECEAVPAGAAPPAAMPAGRLDLVAKGKGDGRSARWATALHALAPLHAPGGVLFDECVDATFGWPDPLGFARRVHATPWIGCVHAPPEPPTHLAPFARHGLEALWKTAELQRSLEHCLGLLTFTERAADWLRAHTDIPVSAVPRPFDAPQARFDFERFASGPERQLVQLGWWMTRLNSICDLPLLASNALGLRKVRGVAAAHHRIAIGLARAERAHDGWGSSAAIMATADGGSLAPSERTRALQTAVVFADLYDANADPVVGECMGSATPILVNRHPGVVEQLGSDYPLYFDALEDAAAKVVDLDAIESAHRYLCRDDVRERATPDAFLSAIRDSDVFAGLG